MQVGVLLAAASQADVIRKKCTALRGGARRRSSRRNHRRHLVCQATINCFI
ncbi:hypothetical protein FOCC_FOCC001962, partial [Frankliniella occidentalis]